MATQANDSIRDVFVSYARADSEIVNELVVCLESVGLTTWRDTRDIDEFDSITRRLEEGMATSRCVVMCLSQTYPARPACQWEALEVLRRLPHGEIGRRLFPVVVQDGALEHTWAILSDLQVSLADNIAEHTPSANDQLHTGSDSQGPERWLPYATEVRRRVEELSDQPPIGPAPALQRTWFPSAPEAKDSFSGRLSEMLALHSMLIGTKAAFDGGRPGLLPSVTVSGMGGVGKSLLVAEYALRLAGYWPGGVVRVNCGGDALGHQITTEDPRFLEHVALQLADLARFWEGTRNPESGPAAVRIAAGRTAQAPTEAADPLTEGTPPRSATLPALTAMQVARNLVGQVQEDLARRLVDSGRDRILWWLDDVPLGVGADDLNLVRCPVPGVAACVVTTRTGDYGQPRWSIHLTPLEVSEGMAVLATYRDDPDAPLSVSERHWLRAISETLGGYPLALDVTGALRMRTRTTWEDVARGLHVDPVGHYETFLDNRGLTHESRSRLSGHEPSIRVTLEASLAHVNQASPVAYRALLACSLLGPGEQFPRGLIADMLHGGATADTNLDAPLAEAAVLGLLNLSSHSARVHAVVVETIVATGRLHDAAAHDLIGHIGRLAIDVAWVVEAIAKWGPATTAKVLSVAEPSPPIAMVLKVLEPSLNQRAGDLSTGDIATALAWECLRQGRADLHAELVRNLRGLRGIRWLPQATSDRADGRLWKVFPGLQPTVAIGTLSLGDTVVATATADAVLLSSFESGRPAMEPLRGHEAKVRALRFLPTREGRTQIVSGARDRTVRVWDVENAGQPCAVLTGAASWVESVAVHSQKSVRWIGAGTRTGEVLVWSQEDDAPWQEYSHLTTSGGPVRSLAFGEDAHGQLVLFVPDGDDIRQWEVEARSWATVPLQVPGDAVLCIATAVDPDGRTVLASGSVDAVVRVWRPFESLAPIAEHSAHTSWVTAVDFGFDGDGAPILATGSRDKSIKFLDPSTGAERVPAIRGHSDWVRGLAVDRSASGEFFAASGSADGSVRTWKPEQSGTWTDDGSRHTGWIREIAMAQAHDSSVWLASGGGDRKVQLWNALTGAPYGEPMLDSEDWDAWIRSVAIAVGPDGAVMLASGSHDSLVRVWTATCPDAEVRRLHWHSARVMSVALAPWHGDPPLLASADESGLIAIWDLAGEPSPIRVLPGHSGAVTDLAWAEIVAAQPPEVLVSGQTDGPAEGSDADSGVAKAPILVSGGDDATVRLWHPIRGTSKVLVGHRSAVTSVAARTISPDACIVASGDADGVVRFWDAVTAQPSAAPINTANGGITSIALGRSGSGAAIVAVGGRDHTVGLWNAQTCRPLGSTFVGHTDVVRSLAVTTLPDGSMLVSTGSGKSWNSFQILGL
jgi:WD40 repeat protein